MVGTISKEIYVKSVNGLSEIIAEIFVDMADKLPEKDSISGRILHQGSIAYVIKTGELYVMGIDGRWYSSEGGEIANITPETEVANESAQNT